MTSQQYIVAFSGHRNYDNGANSELLSTIEKLYDDGARTFRVGMAEGFDLAAGMAVLELMKRHDDILLEADIPYPSFILRHTNTDRTRYNIILSKAGIVRYAGPQYQKGIFHRRNDMLIADATHLVAWWDGSQSGTGYTVSRARKMGCNIINLYHIAE